MFFAKVSNCTRCANDTIIRMTSHALMSNFDTNNLSTSEELVNIAG